MPLITRPNSTNAEICRASRFNKEELLTSLTKKPYSPFQASYPYIDYGTKPPQINPSLNIANTSITSGRSTNQSDYLCGSGYINGYEGDDLITGSSKNDLIFGGAGDDAIISGGGSDYIYGGSGNDTIDMRSNTGVSHVEGGAGRDTFIVNSGQGHTFFEGYNRSEDRLDARACGVGGDLVSAIATGRALCQW